MKYLVHHSTVYDYLEAVTLSHNVVRLRPRANDWQNCLRHNLTITPAPNSQDEWVDYFGNYNDYFCLQKSHRRLAIVAESEVEVLPPPHPDPDSGPAWEKARDILAHPGTAAERSANEFCFDSRYVSRDADLANYAAPSFFEGRELADACLDLTRRIHREFEYLPGSTTIGTPVNEVLQTRRGVCQDFAHLQIGCLRSLGLAARYVSGYLVTTPPPGQPRLQGSDVSHAWVSVFIPGFGWADYDPTNGIMPTDGHVALAWARDYDDVGPIRGMLVGGRRQHLHVAVDVLPIPEAT